MTNDNRRRSHRAAARAGLCSLLALLSAACGDDSRSTNPTCTPAASPGGAAPVFVRNLSIGNTGWFSSPAVVDLDADGAKEIVAPFYDIAVWSADGTLLDRAESGAGQPIQGRVYAPAVVADLEGDTTTEIVAASGNGQVAAFEWTGGRLVPKSGWPASTCDGGTCGENRSLAAADIDLDGDIEIVAGTSETGTEAYVYVFNPDGTPFQPPGIAWPAWPRYNTLSGPGGDADRNCQGHNGYGMYGMNLGIGNIDDDPELEILGTYDNHHIQAFHIDGTALDTEFRIRGRDGEHRWFKTRSTPIRDAGGAVVKWYATSTDVDDLKRSAAT